MEIVGAIALLLFLGWLIPSPLSWFRRRAMEKAHVVDIVKLEAEINLLRTHLHTKMEVDADGMTNLKTENEKLKRANENLRVTIQTLSTKPEQAELRLLHMYDRALKIMERKFPVFVPTWRTIFKHAEMEMQQADQGNAALAKRVFRPRALPDEVPTAEQKLLGARELNNGDAK
jgi:hypothetical protein